MIDKTLDKKFFVWYVLSVTREMLLIKVNKMDIVKSFGKGKVNLVNKYDVKRGLDAAIDRLQSAGDLSSDR